MIDDESRLYPDRINSPKPMPAMDEEDKPQAPTAPKRLGLSDFGFQNVRWEDQSVLRGGSVEASPMEIESFNRLKMAEQAMIEADAEASAEEEERFRAKLGHPKTVFEETKALPMGIGSRLVDVLGGVAWAGEWVRDQAIRAGVMKTERGTRDERGHYDIDPVDKSFLIQDDEDGRFFLDNTGKRHAVPNFVAENPESSPGPSVSGSGPSTYAPRAGEYLQKRFESNVAAMRKAYRAGKAPELRWLYDIQEAAHERNAYYSQTTFGMILSEVGLGIADLALIMATGAAMRGILSPITKAGQLAMRSETALGLRVASTGRAGEFVARMAKLSNHAGLPAFMALSHTTDYITQNPGASPAEVGKQFFKGGALGAGMAVGFHGLSKTPGVPFHRLWNYLNKRQPSVFNSSISELWVFPQQKLTQAGGGIVMMGYPWMRLNEDGTIKWNVSGMVTGAIYGAMTPGRGARLRAYAAEDARLQLENEAATLRRPKKVFAPENRSAQAELSLPFARALLKDQISISPETRILVEKLVTDRGSIRGEDGQPLTIDQIKQRWILGEDATNIDRAIELFNRALTDPDVHYRDLWRGYLAVDHRVTGYRPLDAEGRPMEHIDTVGPEQASNITIRGLDLDGKGTPRTHATTEHYGMEAALEVPGELLAAAHERAVTVNVHIPETPQAAKKIRDGKGAFRVRLPDYSNFEMGWLGRGVIASSDAEAAATRFKESKTSKRKKINFEATGRGETKAETIEGTVGLENPLVFTTEAEARAWFSEKGFEQDPTTAGEVVDRTNAVLDRGHDGIIIGSMAKPELVVAYDARNVRAINIEPGKNIRSGATLFDVPGPDYVEKDSSGKPKPIKVSKSEIAQDDNGNTIVPFWHTTSEIKSAGGSSKIGGEYPRGKRPGNYYAVVRRATGTETVSKMASEGVGKVKEKFARDDKKKQLESEVIGPKGKKKRKEFREEGKRLGLTDPEFIRGDDGKIAGRKERDPNVKETLSEYVERRKREHIEEGMKEAFPDVEVPREGWEVVDVRRMDKKIEAVIHERKTDAEMRSAHQEIMSKRLGHRIRHFYNNVNRWTKDLTQERRDERLDREIQTMLGDDVRLVSEADAPGGIVRAADGKIAQTRDYTLNNLTQNQYERLRMLLSIPRGRPGRTLVNVEQFYPDPVTGEPDPTKPRKKGTFPIWSDEFEAYARALDSGPGVGVFRGFKHDLTNPLYLFEKSDPKELSIGDLERIAAERRRFQRQGLEVARVTDLPLTLKRIHFTGACHAYYNFMKSRDGFNESIGTYLNRWEKEFIKEQDLRDTSGVPLKKLDMKNVWEKFGIIRIAMDSDGLPTLARHFLENNGGKLERFFPFITEKVMGEKGEIQYRPKRFKIPMAPDDSGSVFNLISDREGVLDRNEPGREFYTYRLKPEFQLSPMEQSLFRFMDTQYASLRRIYNDARVQMGLEPVQHEMGYWRMFRATEGRGDGGFDMLGEAKSNTLFDRVKAENEHLDNMMMSALSSRLMNRIKSRLWERPPAAKRSKFERLRATKAVKPTLGNTEVVTQEGKARSHSTRMVTVNEQVVFDRLMENLLTFSHMGPELSRQRQLLEYATPSPTADPKGGQHLGRVAPNLKNYIETWLDYNSGKRVAGTIDKIPAIRHIDRAASILMKNAHYAVLSGNLRTAIIQLSAVRSAYVFAGPEHTMRALQLTINDFITSGWEGLKAGGESVAQREFGSTLNRALDAASQRYKRGFYRGQLERSSFLPTREKQFAWVDVQGEGGLKNMAKGMNALYTPGGKIRKGIESAKAGMLTLGDLGFKPLELTDRFTTRWTRGAFELKSKELGLRGFGPKGQASDWVDEWAMKGAGSTTRMNRPAIFYSHFGRALGLFQNFHIADWNLLTHEVLGSGREKMTHAEQFRRMFSYIMWTTANNIMYEQLIPAITPERLHYGSFGGGRFHSGFGTPVGAYLGGQFPIIANLKWKDIKKVVENDDMSIFQKGGAILKMGHQYNVDAWKALPINAPEGAPQYQPASTRLINSAREILEVIPIAGGSFRFQSHPAGMILGEMFGGFAELAGDKNLGSSKSIQKFLALSLVAMGAPGFYQMKKTTKGLTKYASGDIDPTPQMVLAKQQILEAAEANKDFRQAMRIMQGKEQGLTINGSETAEQIAAIGEKIAAANPENTEELNGILLELRDLWYGISGVPAKNRK